MFFQDEIDIVPPPEGDVPVVITPEEKAANDLRLAYEDSIRNSYVATLSMRQMIPKMAIW